MRMIQKNAYIYFMKSRLNLTIDEDLLKSTKHYAEVHQTSISELAENYFRSITKPINRKTIIDLVDGLDKPAIDVNANLKDLYYKGKKNGN